MDYNVYDACDDIVIDSGSKVSADEILAQKLDNAVPIPLLTRDELNQMVAKDREAGIFEGDLLPSIDLRAVHYFATQLCLRKYPHLMNALDETSLITLGLIIERWVQEYFESTKEEPPISTADDEQETLETHALTPEIREGPSQTIVKSLNHNDTPSNI